jgi:hypothetical protein
MEGSCRAAAVLTFSQALAVTAAATVASAVWLYACRRAAAPGLARLAVAAPVVVVNIMLPALLFCREECTTMLLLSFNHSWLCSFKVGSVRVHMGKEHFEHRQARVFQPTVISTCEVSALIKTLAADCRPSPGLWIAAP